MPASLDWSWNFDGWIVLAGILCAVASSLLGCFLVLRRMSLLGDAISHAVLPGLAAAFLITESRSSLAMFFGAVIVGVLTALLTEWIRGAGRVDEGASMGVVFTSLFALGLIMIVQAADHVDLDPGCVLYGAIETTPLDTVLLFGTRIPRIVLTLGPVCLVNALFVLFFFKELRISSFDPALATASGFNARLLHYLLMILVAITAVASFESVGNILVVAMFIVPPAAACLLTDRLVVMIGLSVILAASAAVLGHLGAITVPGWFGYKSTTTAGMMAIAAGLIFVLAMTFAPRHGVLVKLIRRRALAWKILADDILAFLYRREEQGYATPVSAVDLKRALLAGNPGWQAVLWRASRLGLLSRSGGTLELSAAGRERAQELVRSHRLWEQYLVSHAGLDAGRIHDKAEQLEHFTDTGMREQLNVATESATIDPHGAPIPPEASASQ
jgi:manganese/zinc/iron transport system permease protein